MWFRKALFPGRRPRLLGRRARFPGRRARSPEACRMAQLKEDQGISQSQGAKVGGGSDSPSLPLHSQMFIGTSQRHALHCVSLRLLFHVRFRVQVQSLSICSNFSFPFPSENPCQRAYLLLEEEMQPWT